LMTPTKPAKSTPSTAPPISKSAADVYKTYLGDGSVAAGWPSMDQWLDFETLVSVPCELSQYMNANTLFSGRRTRRPFLPHAPSSTFRTTRKPKSNSSNEPSSPSQLSQAASTNVLCWPSSCRSPRLAFVYIPLHGTTITRASCKRIKERDRATWVVQYRIRAQSPRSSK
jgi:hypothetical protein